MNKHDIDQIIYALERARCQLEEHANRLFAQHDYGAELLAEDAERMREAIELLRRPIDMVLYCPACGLQHLDAPETDAEYTERLHESSWWECGGEKPERWVNGPHRSHLCHGCGHIWRPADVPTNGVAAIKTVGKHDSPVRR